jgi:hypothetical protein
MERNLSLNRGVFELIWAIIVTATPLGAEVALSNGDPTFAHFPAQEDALTLAPHASKRRELGN